MISFLEKSLDLSREYASVFAPYDHIADPMIDEADEGLTTATIKRLFGELRRGQRCGPDAGSAPEHNCRASRDGGHFKSPSAGVLDQLHARPIFSLISDTPDSTKFVSLFSPAAVRALMKTLPLSGRARMNSSGFGANAARPFIDGRHASLIGS